MSYNLITLVFAVIIMALVPFIIFGYAVNFATIEHQNNEIIIMKDEICRLNHIIEELKGNQRACWIPSAEKVIKPNMVN